MVRSQQEYDEQRSQIQAKLVEYIPKYFASLDLQSPAYCLFLLYDDGGSLDLTPVIEIGTSELMLACNNEIVDGLSLIHI